MHMHLNRMLYGPVYDGRLSDVYKKLEKELIVMIVNLTCILKFETQKSVSFELDNSFIRNQFLHELLLKEFKIVRKIFFLCT